MQIKTDQELTIEIRNSVAMRIVEQDLSADYWQAESKKLKHNSQEKVDALKRVSINKQLSFADRKYLKIIDKRLEQHG